MVSKILKTTLKRLFYWLGDGAQQILQKCKHYSNTQQESRQKEFRVLEMRWVFYKLRAAYKVFSLHPSVYLAKSEFAEVNRRRGQTCPTALMA